MYLYTAYQDEINGLLREDDAWVEEGIVFQESIKSETPVYRLINTKTREHYFTADNDLANKMITEQAKEGWQNDTISKNNCLLFSR